MNNKSKEIELIEEINKETNHKGADVVFEVSGTQTGVDVMTECAATRGRIVMVEFMQKNQLLICLSFLEKIRVNWSSCLRKGRL